MPRPRVELPGRRHTVDARFRVTPFLARGIALTAAAALLLGAQLSSQEREFTRTRDWHVPYRGEHELELRSFFDTSHGDYSGQLEYEYGVTDSFAFEPGIEFREEGDGDWEVEAAEVELRFALGEFRRDAWLPGLNVEYEYSFEDEESNALVLKGVLSRYGELDDFTINLNVERELEHERETATELTGGWIRSLGLGGSRESDESYDSYESKQWKAGIEGVQDFEEHDLRLGPVVNLRLDRHMNFVASWLFAIDDRHKGNFDELGIIIEFEL